MKIGILTFHASHNYGSMLQAYALQHYLLMHGHEAETINLRIKAQQDFYHFPLIPLKGKLKEYIKTFSNPVWLYHACRKWWKYETFLKENLRLTPKTYKSWEEILDDLPNLSYQCIITGGDQIWNMNCKDFSESYYVPSNLSNIRKIAYSPSFGGTFLSKITEEQEAFIQKSVADYTKVSVRETSMQQYLENLLGRDVSVTVDPTLLLRTEDYSKIIPEEPIVKDKYIYYYTPRINAKYEKLALLIGKKLGMKVITSFPRVYQNQGFSSVPETGPAEFLNLLKNASLVVGKSFHLVVFSLLFHKEFIAFDGCNDARMKSILEKLNILERGCVDENNYDSMKLSPIDFIEVDQILLQERIQSELFLRDVLL